MQNKVTREQRIAWQREQLNRASDMPEDIRAIFNTFIDREDEANPTRDKLDACLANYGTAAELTFLSNQLITETHARQSDLDKVRLYLNQRYQLYLKEKRESSHEN